MDILNYREETLVLDEGVNDPGIFKAIILAGGPGSGKSYIADKLGLGEVVGELETQETWHPNEKNSVGHTMNEFVCNVSEKW